MWVRAATQDLVLAYLQQENNEEVTLCVLNRLGEPVKEVGKFTEAGTFEVNEAALFCGGIKLVVV